MVLAAVVLFERNTGLRSAGTNMLFWLGMLGYGTVKIRSLVLISMDPPVRADDVPPSPQPAPSLSTGHFWPLPQIS